MNRSGEFAYKQLIMILLVLAMLVFFIFFSRTLRLHIVEAFDTFFGFLR